MVPDEPWLYFFIKEIMNDLTVAVWMLTYNHEKFIGDAIESVIRQKTNFNFKIFLSEDFSEDSTRNICIELAKKYSEKIDLFLPTKNLGINSKNNISILTYERCFDSGAKYIAMLEGDDYWKDENKLQRQVDLLESNSTFGSSYHRSCVVDESGKLLKADKRVGYADHKGEDLIKGKGEMLTNTIMFRNQLTLPDSFYSVPNGDTYLWHLLGFMGDCKFQNEIEPAAYRLHGAGVWSGANEKNKIISLCITYGVIYDNLKLKHCDTSYLIQIVQKNVNRYLLNKLSNRQFREYFYFLNYGRRIEFLKSFNFLSNHLIFIFSAIGTKIKDN